VSEELWRQSASAIATEVNAGRIDAVDVVKAHASRRDQWEPHVHALLTTLDEDSTSTAAGGPRGPLAGVPVVVKDNICTKSVRTTCGSRILENYHPEYDATAIRRLREAGAILTAKANCDEFAMGSSTENSAYGPTHNPYDLDYVPGGSSGGSAAAVDCGMSPISLGSDTGGSVRQPASFTNLVGLKPTYGRLSRYGLVAFGSSLDQIGIFGRRLEDVALAFTVMAGPDEMDMTSLPDAAPSYEELDLSPGAARGMTVGVPRNILAEGLHPEVESAQLRTEEALSRAGVRVVDVDLIAPPAGVAAYYLIATAEASSNLARFDGVRYGYRSPEAQDVLSLYTSTRGEGFGREVIRRILLGTFALSAGYYDAYYLKALRAREMIRQNVLQALAGVDALLYPVSPTPHRP
jgi:aspartyl-tRNA(Asn)/glutamyl-tRNA(Gln) amidotransferase subunit A